MYILDWVAISARQWQSLAVSSARYLSMRQARAEALSGGFSTEGYCSRY